MILCIGSFVEMCMDLEFAIQSEANQREEKKYHMLTHMCGIQEKNGTDDPNFQGRKRDADTENRHVDTVRDGEGGRIGVDIYIPPCVKQRASWNLL